MKLSRNLSAAFFITTVLLTRLAPGAYAQSGVFLDNIGNTSTNSSSLTNGLFFVQTNGSSPVKIHQDFNAAFYGGTNATNLSLIATFLLSDGTANGDNIYGAGTFLDPTGTERMMSGASSWAYFQIQAWLGTYTNYATAAAAGAYCKQSAVFSNSVAAVPSPPPDLTGMPAIILTAGGSGSSPSGFAGDGGSSGGGSSPSGTPPVGPSGPLDAGSGIFPCGGLWLSVTTSNTTAALTLHNTRPGQTYLVWSTQVVSAPFTNWGLEKSLVGAAGNTTQTNIAMGSRSNLYFRATEYRIYTNTTVFPGLNFADSLKANPDTMGAIGPYFCELLNGSTNSSSVAFAVYDKSGVTNLAHTNISGFFAVHDPDGTNYPTGQVVDPRILYDSQFQCFVASAIDQGSQQVLFAVCTNAYNATNLTTGWKRYVLRVFQNGASTSDFDTLGFDANGIYLSVLQLGTNVHTVVAIKKPEIYQGELVAVYFFTNNADLNLVTLQPAVNFDSVAANSYAWFVAKGQPNLTNYQGGSIYYRRLQWSGTNAAWADTNNWITLSTTTNYQDYFDLDPTNSSNVTGISAPQPNPQINGKIGLYYIGSRLAATTIRNGFLWTCQAVGLNTNGVYTGDSSGLNVTRSGMQWFKLQISPDSSSLSLADYGRIYDTNRVTDNPWWYYFPSLMVNCAGDMVAGFSGSTGTNYASAFYTWRLSNGAMLAQPGIFQAGTSGAGNRLGDYSATTLDPVDDWSFWTVQEYATNVLGSHWGTVIGKIRPNP